MEQAIDPQWAWKPYRPSEQSAWDLKKVGHLFRRAAFGATWDELQSALSAGPDKTIDLLLHGRPGQAEFDQQTSSLAESLARGNSGPQAAAWWVYRMLYNPHPLKEKLTLFWHNHFATSNSKVNNAGAMLGQYRLMYQHALGNFHTLLQEMSKDPAMMVWLDTSLSKKGMPNENYARELMELFSLGIGHYTETDIREAAKAFTGWRIESRQSIFDPKQHDDGEKSVLGKKGKWIGADIVRICLEQEVAPYFIVGKLYRFLISETVPYTAELLAPLAAQFRKSDYDFGKLVETMLRSNLFFSPMVYRTRVKSPVEFAVGTVHALEGQTGGTALAGVMEELGQRLFYPPSVKGWDGGAAWLNGQTLLLRQNLALALTSTEDGRFGRRTDPAILLDRHGKRGDDAVIDFFLRLFLDNEVTSEARGRLTDYAKQSRHVNVPVYWTPEDTTQHRIRTLCHLVLTLPEFQLS